MPARARLRLAYFVFFFGHAAYWAFAPLHFERLGFSGAQVGALAAIGPLVGLFAQPWWGRRSDERQAPLRIIKANLLIAGAIALLLPFFDAFWPLVLGVAVFMFFQTPLGALLNGVTLRALGRDASGGFGRIRLYGSWGFTAGVLITGWILQSAATDALFVFYTLSMLALAVLLWPKRDVPAAASATAFATSAPATAASAAAASTALAAPATPVTAAASERPRLRALLSQSAIAGVMAYSFLNEITMAGGNAFLSIYIDDLGGTESQVGAAHMVGSMACIPLFYFSKNLIERFGAPAVLMIGTLASVARWALTPLAQEPWTAIAVQLLHGPGFALTYAAAVSLVHALTPPELSSSGQTAFASLTVGLGGMIGGISAGLVVDYAGIRPLFFACAALAALTLLAGPVLLRRVRPLERAQAA